MGIRDTRVPLVLDKDIEQGAGTIAEAADENSFPSEATSTGAKGGLDLEWKNIQCFVSEPLKQGRVAKWLGLEESMGPPTKQILRGASGFARAGQVLAVMGPSGSGKTTLLNILAQRPTLGKKGRWTGELLLNGCTPWKDWEREMSYVMQKDIFYDELKVWENLWTTGLLRLPYDWPTTQKQTFLEKMVHDLGLEKVKNTKVGTAVERGLSGGEVKRTSIANECLALPRVFLLDEPLTGLDSHRAVEVMTGLLRRAREEGTTVVLTIHQPSSELYNCFDRLLLLGPGGRTAYFGDVEGAVEHFASIGHPVPPLWAPSDHYIKLLSSEATREDICCAWESVEPPQGPSASERPPPLTPMPPLRYQMQVLLPRALKRIKRSYLKPLNWKLHFGLAATWGLIYFAVGRAIPSKLTDFVGAVFFIVAHWSWTPLFQGLGNFPREREMLTKEKASKVYDDKAWFLTQVVAEAPILLVLPLLFFAIIWPMAAMPFGVLPQVFIFVAANIQVAASMSMFISIWCMDEDTAIASAIVVMVFMMCAGGYFADMRLLPWWISWVRYTSFYYYTFGATLRLMLAGPYGEAVHQEALGHYSFSELGYTAELLALFLMAAFYRVVAFFKLRYTKKLQFS